MRNLLNVFCLCALLVGGAFAQGDRGTITGTVTDPSGAVIVGAKVIAENSETHNIMETTTTSTGNFTLAQVPSRNPPALCTNPLGCASVPLVKMRKESAR